MPENGEALRASPEIVAARVVDSGVQVTYRVPGADGGNWPVLSISVRAPAYPLPATSQEVRSVEEVGTAVVPMEIEPGRELVAFGSAFYEDGQRVSLPEAPVHPQASAGGGTERKPDRPTGGGFDGYWEAIGRVTWVSPNINSNQPVGTVRRRPWKFQEICAAKCRMVFTRGTLYGPSVTRLVRRGRTFVAEFPPVQVPCSYPPGSNEPRRPYGQSHSRYKLWWSGDHRQLHAVEHRFQTGCYERPERPDVTRWRATRASSPVNPEDATPSG